MAKRYENETWIEWYRRELGTIDRYREMTLTQLSQKVSQLQRELGSALVHLRRDPNSLTGKEMLDLVEPHYLAALKELRRA
jgi:hypothetical protein